MTNRLDARFENVTRTLWAVAAAFTLSVAPAAAYAADTAAISRDAQAALNALYAKVPAAKTIGAKAQAVLVFPKITKAGLGIGGQYGDGALIKGGKTVALLQHNGCVVRPAGRSAAVRLRDVLHERRRAETARQDRRLRGWRRSEHRRNGRREGQIHDDHIGEGRHLRVHLQSEGFNGRARSARQQDHEARCQVGES